MQSAPALIGPITAIFIIWDDWGGFYDRVAPPIYNSYEYGFRVPWIIVSPYAKQQYVSHVTHHFDSILKFIEKNFVIPSLGFADSRADDFSDCFDFTQVPLDFQIIGAPLGMKHFLNDKTPLTGPDDIQATSHVLSHRKSLHREHYGGCMLR